MVKNSLVIILHIAILFVFNAIGNWFQETLHLFIPGSVVGLLLLWAAFQFRLIRLEWIERGTIFMNRHMIVFFFPATVGIINYYEVFQGKGLWLVVIVMISTVLVMVVSGGISQWLMQKVRWKNE